jgi:hypothetical protein
MSAFTKVQDSGERRKFTTGSVRDKAAGKGRFDLIPEFCEARLARHYENGATKYEERNWEKGQPLSVYLSSARRHWGKMLLNWQDEDHAAACVWNIYGYMWTRNEIEQGRLPRELDDLGHTAKAEEPGQMASNNAAGFRVCLNCHRPIFRDDNLVWRHASDFTYYCGDDLNFAIPVPVAIDDQKCIEHLTGKPVRETAAEHKAKMQALIEGRPAGWAEGIPKGMEEELVRAMSGPEPNTQARNVERFMDRVDARDMTPTDAELPIPTHARRKDLCPICGRGRYDYGEGTQAYHVRNNSDHCGDTFRRIEPERPAFLRKIMD